MASKQLYKKEKFNGNKNPNRKEVRDFRLNYRIEYFLRRPRYV